MKAELFFDARHDLAEGPVWFDDALWWVNIPKGEHHRLAGPMHELRTMGRYIGAVVPTSVKDRWLLAADDGFQFLNWATGTLTAIVDPEADRPRNRFNDGKCDSRGRFWAGTMSMDDERDAAALYVLDRELKCHRAFAPLSLSNGLAWSADDSTMYHVDSPTRRVWAFDFDAYRGEISNTRIIFDLEKSKTEGFPDGMTIDRDGNLWIALWGGGAVIAVDPRTNRLVEKIDLPVEQVTSCCFGGEKLDELFITTARQGLSAEQLRTQGDAGGIFRVRPGVNGLPVRRFEAPG